MGKSVFLFCSVLICVFDSVREKLVGNIELSKEDMSNLILFETRKLPSSKP